MVKLVLAVVVLVVLQALTTKAAVLEAVVLD